MRIAPIVRSIALAAGLAACSTASAEPNRAHELVDEGATLLDVRTPGEFASGHVEGAVNIPVQELGARMAEVPRDRPVVVYCHSGARSASAAERLSSDGYEVLDLGAMSNW